MARGEEDGEGRLAAFEGMRYRAWVGDPRLGVETAEKS